MESKSITLFPAEPLLEQRLGRERFEAVPTSPGVYRFYDSSGALLYVGKAKNLRSRLFSYKRARAGGVSRKVAEMIGQIASFVYVETETERDALLLENRMIRGDRPPYNHANKQPETYYFVYLKPGETELEFRLAMRIHEETDEAFWHGCFKGHAPVRQSFGCILLGVLCVLCGLTAGGAEGFVYHKYQNVIHKHFCVAQMRHKNQREREKLEWLGDNSHYDDLLYLRDQRDLRATLVVLALSSNQNRSLADLADFAERVKTGAFIIYHFLCGSVTLRALSSIASARIIMEVKINLNYIFVFRLNYF